MHQCFSSPKPLCSAVCNSPGVAFPHFSLLDVDATALAYGLQQCAASMPTAAFTTAGDNVDREPSSSIQEISATGPYGIEAVLWHPLAVATAIPQGTLCHIISGWDSGVLMCFGTQMHYAAIP